MADEYANEFSAQFRKVLDRFEVVQNTNFRKKSIPSVANSQFTINDKIGSWAESLVFRGLRENPIESVNSIPVMYGRSDQLVAGEDGFKELWQEHMDELMTIGKRPDILLFDEEATGVSLSGHENITNLQEKWEFIPEALAGIEVRSSQQNITVNEEYKRNTISKHVEELQSTLPRLIKDFTDLENWEYTNHVLDWLDSLNVAEDIPYEIPKKPSLTKNKYEESLIQRFNQTWNLLKEINKLHYSFLSFTVKVEDLEITERWVSTYSVPHYYFQVFDDRVYGIPTLKSLESVLDKKGKNLIWKLEQADKNQNKPTFYVSIDQGYHIGNITIPPEISAEKILLKKGRIIYAVNFHGGELTVNQDELAKCLGYKTPAESHNVGNGRWWKAILLLASVAAVGYFLLV